jgi:rfaE bifunctional protein nucleotidyltransferase chain/domain
MTGSVPRPPSSKICDRRDLLERAGRPREGRLVFTNGCFDLLHQGHVSLLAKARALGDQLVVAVNSDRSVRALKGPSRPWTPERDRALVLAALEAVDHVTIFDEDTPLALIRELLPDVLVKGADYAEREIVGRTEVLEAGGEVLTLPLVRGASTSSLIARIQRGA